MFLTTYRISQPTLPTQQVFGAALSIQIEYAFAGYGVSHSKATVKVFKSVSERIERRDHFGASSNQSRAMQMRRLRSSEPQVLTA